MTAAAEQLPTQKGGAPLTAERLREVLVYDPDTGVFRWSLPRRKVRVGHIAGCANPTNGYWVIRLDRKLYGAHQLAWLYVHGVWPKNDIDHRDLNRTNNAIANLREGTRSQNMANTRARGNYGKGVWLHKSSGLFAASIRAGGVKRHLGYFKTPEAAHAAYCQAALVLNGEFARA